MPVPAQAGPEVGRSVGPNTPRRIFSPIAANYDRPAQLLSLLQYSRWHDFLLSRLDLPSEARVLDMATGTGAVALRLCQRDGLRVAAADVTHRSFPVFSKAVGLKKWEWVFLRPAAKNPSLLAKKVDAIGTFTTVGIPLRIQAKKMGDGIVEFLWSDFGVRLPTDGIVTHDKTIAEKPGQIRRFLSATLEGNAWAIEHPKEAVDIFQKSRPDARRSLTAAFWDLSSRFQVWGSLKKHGLGHFDRGVMEYTRKAIIEAYQLKNPPALDDIYTAEFLPKELPKPKLPKPAM